MVIPANEEFVRTLRYDPVSPLLASGVKAIEYFVLRDLLRQEVGDTAQSGIWGSREVAGIVRHQLPNGSWRGHGGSRADPGVKYSLVEAYRNLRILVDKYGMDRSQAPVEAAAEYVFSCQTAEGDIRGILGNQYAPYYTGALLGLLIKAGYADDERVDQGIRWLAEMRQDDGGWAIGSPGMIGDPKLTWKDTIELITRGDAPTMQAFDRSRPFSAAATGMAIRAFAAHPQYRRSDVALKAVGLLKSKLLKKDNWSSYEHPDNWVRFQYPFWWTNLVSALDSLSAIGLPLEDVDIARGIEWLMEHQQPDGLWKISYSSIHKAPEKVGTVIAQCWVTLAICRVLARFGISLDA